MTPRTRDSYFAEYYQLKADLKGISPKLELYTVLHERLLELKVLIGEEDSVK